MTARIYVPATRPLLAAWFEAAAVPGDAERVMSNGDDEDSEYDALLTAAELALALRPDDGRRVVLVAETGRGEADGAVPLRQWVAVHCDVADRAADADPDDDLGWFAVQEIPDLI